MRDIVMFNCRYAIHKDRFNLDSCKNQFYSLGPATILSSDHISWQPPRKMAFSYLTQKLQLPTN